MNRERVGQVRTGVAAKWRSMMTVITVTFVLSAARGAYATQDTQEAPAPLPVARVLVDQEPPAQAATALVVEQFMSYDGTEVSVRWLAAPCTGQPDTTLDFTLEAQAVGDSSAEVAARERVPGRCGAPVRGTLSGLQPHLSYRVVVRAEGMRESPPLVTAPRDVPRGFGTDVDFFALTDVPVDAGWDMTLDAVAADYNGDGYMDLFVCSQSRNGMYFSDGAGGFAKVEIGVAWGYAATTGAVAEDLDGDGDVDLFVANRGKANQLLLNNGTGHFVEVTEGPGLTHEDMNTGVVAADFDGDGDLDIFLIARTGKNELLLNDGAAGLVNVTGGNATARADNSFGVAAADFDGDGDVDLYVANGRETDDGQVANNELLLNDGIGVFTAVTTGAAVARVDHSYGAVAADFDGDGDLDLFVTNDGAMAPTGQNQLLLNDGAARFVAVDNSAVVGTDSNSYGPAVAADFDGDGDVDLFVATYYSVNELFLNDGKGDFVAKTSGAVVENKKASMGAIGADFDGDGNTDLYICNYRAKNELLLNIATGGFEADTSGDAVTRADDSYAAVAADFNDDGYMDIFVVNYEAANELLLNDGAGAFAAMNDGDAVEGRYNSMGVAAADFDGDGSVDLFVVNRRRENDLLLNDGAGGFVFATTGPAVARADDSYGAVAADFDGDGSIDLFVANQNGMENELLLNDGAARFANVTGGAATSSADSSNGAVAADFDNDGDMDIYVVNDGVNKMLLNDGAGEFSNAPSGDAVARADESTAAVAADFDGDGDLDLFVSNCKAANELFLNDGAGGFAAVVNSSAIAGNGTLGCSAGVVAGDFDGDGDVDIFVQNYGIRGGAVSGEMAPEQNELLLNDGTGSFTIVLSGAAVDRYDNSRGAVSADFDGDGDVDIFVVNTGWNELLMSCGRYLNPTPGFHSCLPMRPPSITHVAPSTASTEGGNPMVLLGSYFSDPELTIQVGDTVCSGPARVREDLATCVLAEGSAASLRVEVESYGRVGVLDAGFSYERPVLESVAQVLVHPQEPDTVTERLVGRPFLEHRSAARGAGSSHGVELLILGRNFGPLVGTNRTVRVGSYACSPLPELGNYWVDQLLGDQMQADWAERIKSVGDEMEDSRSHHWHIPCAVTDPAFPTDFDVHAVEVVISGQSSGAKPVYSPSTHVCLVQYDWSGGRPAEYPTDFSFFVFGADDALPRVWDEESWDVTTPMANETEGGGEGEPEQSGEVGGGGGGGRNPSKATGRSACLCKRGHHFDGRACVPCSVGFFSRSEPSPGCHPCPRGAICRGQDSIKVLPGWTLQEPDSGGLAVAPPTLNWTDGAPTSVSALAALGHIAPGFRVQLVGADGIPASEADSAVPGSVAMVTGAPCRVKVGAGMDLLGGGTEVPLVDGAVDFTALQLRGEVGRTYQVSVSCWLPFRENAQSDADRQELGPITASIRVLPCDAGEVLGDRSYARGGLTCNPCPAGMYSLQSGLTAASDPEGEVDCLECPAGAHCPGRDLVLPEPGHWAEPSQWKAYGEEKVYSCNEGLCEQLATAAITGLTGYNITSALTGNATQVVFPNGTIVDRVSLEAGLKEGKCREGHMGTLCAQCAPGWAYSGQYCAECEEGDAWSSWGGGRQFGSSLAIIIVIVTVLALALGRTIAYADPYFEGIMNAFDIFGQKLLTAAEKADRVKRWVAFFAALKVFVTTTQLMASLTSVFNVIWPESWSGFFRRMRIINLDFFRLPSVSCVWPDPNWSTVLWTNMAAPPMFIAAIAIAHFAGSAYCRMRGLGQAVIGQFTAGCYAFGIFGVSFLYLPVSATAFNTMICQDVYGTEFMRASITQECWTPHHKYMVGVAAVGVVLYPVGIPLLFLYAMRKFRVPTLAAARTDAAKLRAVLLTAVSKAEANGKSITQPEFLAIGDVSTAVLIAAAETLALDIPLPTDPAADRYPSLRSVPRGNLIAMLLQYASDNSNTIAVPPVLWSDSGDEGSLTNFMIEKTGDPSLGMKETNPIFDTINSGTQRVSTVGPAFAVVESTEVAVVVESTEAAAVVESTEVVEQPLPEKWAMTGPEMVKLEDYSAARIGNLYRDYKADRWWYIFLDLARRLTLSSVLLFVEPGTSTQITIGTLLSFSSLLFNAHYGAMADVGVNVVAQLGDLEIFFTCFVALLLKVDVGDATGSDKAVFNGLCGLLAWSIFGIPVGWAIQELRDNWESESMFASWLPYVLRVIGIKPKSVGE